MNATLARLQALRRETGARPGAPVTPPPAIVKPHAPRMDVQQLRQLLRLHEACWAAQRAAPRERILPGAEIAPGLRLVTASLPATWLPGVLDGAFDRRAEAIDPARAVFFDTETTGLAGGTGTRAFMIGAALWHAGTLEVRQLLITTLAAERAMLAEFAGWLRPDTLLVSFNGKCYDAPLLRTRYRLARMGDPLAGLGHVDLLHPSRRRYRGVFENCRLQTLERNVLKIVRDDDLPGSEAPGAWLGYLRGGSSAKLCRVLDHNHQDVVTLARLLVHLATG